VLDGGRSGSRASRARGASKTRELETICGAFHGGLQIDPASRAWGIQTSAVLASFDRRLMRLHSAKSGGLTPRDGYRPCGSTEREGKRRSYNYGSRRSLAREATAKPAIRPRAPSSSHCSNIDLRGALSILSPLPSTLPSTQRSGARERLLGMLQSGQGVVRGCQAELGRALGVSRARVRQLLDDLAAAGAIKVRTSSTGTVVSLVVPIEPAASVH
jgi:hypothetical protein